MSLSGILKLTRRIILLFLVFGPIRALADPSIKLTPPTIEHIKGLYANPFIHNLINQYQDRYLEVLFEHFRTDFQNLPNSHWPTLLQDIGLLPIPYCTDDARQDHRLMLDLWEQRRDHLRTEPIEDYHETMVRVPPAMDNVFQNDAQHYHRETRSVLYEFLVWEMQLFVNHYPARLSKSKRVERRNYMPGKLLRFKAFYWLTVLDRFISTVQLANAVEGVLLSSPFPRTVLDRPDANEVAQQSPRVDLVAAPVAAPVIAQYPLPQQAPGPRAPSPVYPHQIGPRAPPPAYSQLHRPRAQSPLYPPNPGPRVRPMAQQMTHPLAQPEPSGSNPGRRAPSPKRGTKRKATHQGGGPYQRGRKRGPGGSMRSMDGASNEPQVEQMPQAQQSNSGCTALPSISVIIVIIAVSLISFA